MKTLKSLLPLPPVLVGTIREHHADDTSTVELPGNVPLTGYGDGSSATGSLIRPRGGLTIPVGERAFVRAGVVEDRAPSTVVIDIPIGNVGLPPPPPPGGGAMGPITIASSVPSGGTISWTSVTGAASYTVTAGGSVIGSTSSTSMPTGSFTIGASGVCYCVEAFTDNGVSLGEQCLKGYWIGTVDGVDVPGDFVSWCSTYWGGPYEGLGSAGDAAQWGEICYRYQNGNYAGGQKGTSARWVTEPC